MSTERPSHYWNRVFRSEMATARDAMRNRHYRKHGALIARTAIKNARHARLKRDAAEWQEEEWQRSQGVVPAWFAEEYA